MTRKGQLASFKWHFWQNFRWQINNVWKFYISVSYIGSYYFTCISRKSSFAPNFSSLQVFLKFLIIQTKPNFSSPVKHCNFTSPPPPPVFKHDNSNQFAFPKVIQKSGFYCINMMLQITSDMELQLVRKKNLYILLWIKPHWFLFSFVSSQSLYTNSCWRCDNFKPSNCIWAKCICCWCWGRVTVSCNCLSEQ